MIKIINETYELVDKLIEKDNYKQLKKLNQKLNNLYPLLLKDYKDAKEKYDNVLDEGSHYHPDFKSVAKKLSEVKTILFEKEEVKNILKLEKEIELELNEIITNISNVISENIQTPNEIGLLRSKKGGCSIDIKKTIYR